MSPALRTVPGSEDKSKLSLVRATCTCTLCSRTMSLRDFSAHRRGRQHQLALSKVDTNLRQLHESTCIAPTINHGKDIQEGGIIGSDKAASTTIHSTFLDVHRSATPPFSSLAPETVVGSTFSTETVKQMTNKAKRSKKVKQPKSIVESIATPPTSAGLDSLGLNDSRVGLFVDSFPNNLQNSSNTNDFICDQDCGWCGQDMNHLANEYVFPTIHSLTLSLC